MDAHTCGVTMESIHEAPYASALLRRVGEFAFEVVCEGNVELNQRASPSDTSEQLADGVLNKFCLSYFKPDLEPVEVEAGDEGGTETRRNHDDAEDLFGPLAAEPAASPASPAPASAAATSELSPNAPAAFAPAAAFVADSAAAAPVAAGTIEIGFEGGGMGESNESVGSQKESELPSGMDTSFVCEGSRVKMAFGQGQGAQ
eukprot:421615-Pleurochrysis_carterae.AAC.1